MSWTELKHQLSEHRFIPKSKIKCSIFCGSLKRFFSICIAILQCLQLDCRKKNAVCNIIFILHLSCLITCNFESSQTVSAFVEGFFNLNASKIDDTEALKGSLKVLGLHRRDTTEFE